MKNLAITSILFTILFSLTSCTTATEAKKEEVKETVDLPAKAASCVCVKIYMPVCGENKKTYGNSCEADCAGVKYTIGACNPTK